MSSLFMLYSILFLVFLLFSFFFSASETALSSLQKYKVKFMVEAGIRDANRVAHMIERPEKFLSTVLLGNTFVNIAAAALATSLAVSTFGEEQGVLFATIGVTIILLIFCESTPKIIAAHHAERVSLLFVRPLELISWILTPFVIALSWFATALRQ